MGSGQFRKLHQLNVSKFLETSFAKTVWNTPYATMEETVPEDPATESPLCYVEAKAHSQFF